VITDEEPLPTIILQKSLDKLSQALISTWQTSVEGLKKDIKELGSCTAQVEAKMEEI
ncbi:Hypothetical predicted protein, partial [Pelobates cultripes]